MEIIKKEDPVLVVTKEEPLTPLVLTNVDKYLRKQYNGRWFYNKDEILVDSTATPTLAVGVNTYNLVPTYAQIELLGFGSFYTATDIKAEIDLMAENNIHYIRSMVLPYSPGDYRRFFGDYDDPAHAAKRQLYLDKVEELLDYCASKNISICADLNFEYRTIPDYVGGHLSEYGDPNSLVWQTLQLYVSEFVSRFATHPGISMWIAANEMDARVLQRTTFYPINDPYHQWGLGPYFRGLDSLSFQQYLTYLRTMRTVIKENDTAGRLIGAGNNGRIPSSVSGNKINWLHQLYLASKEVDVVSIHNYQNFSGNRELDYSFTEYLTALRKIAKAQNKPFIVEEFGTSDVPPASSVISSDWEQFSGLAREQTEFDAYVAAGVQYVQRWQWAPVGASNILGLHPTYQSGIQLKYDLWNQLYTNILNFDTLYYKDPDSIPVETFTSKANAPCIKFDENGITRLETSVAGLFPNPNYWSMSFWIRVDGTNQEIPQIIPLSNLPANAVEYVGNKGFHMRLSRLFDFSDVSGNLQMVYYWEAGSPTDYRVAPVGTAMKPNTWYHFVVTCGVDKTPTDTYNTGLLCNHEDGEFGVSANFRDFGAFGAGPEDPIGWLPDTTSPLCLGSPLNPAFVSQGLQFSNKTNISIGDLIIFNRPLLDSEVRDLYRKDIVPNATVVARWQFNGDLLDDVTGREFTLTQGTYSFENTLTVPTNIYAEPSETITSALEERSTFNPLIYNT